MTSLYVAEGNLKCYNVACRQSCWCLAKSRNDHVIQSFGSYNVFCIFGSQSKSPFGLGGCCYEPQLTLLPTAELVFSLSNQCDFRANSTV